MPTPQDSKLRVKHLKGGSAQKKNINTFQECLYCLDILSKKQTKQMQTTGKNNNNISGKKLFQSIVY